MTRCAQAATDPCRCHLTAPSFLPVPGPPAFGWVTVSGGSCGAPLGAHRYSQEGQGTEHLWGTVSPSCELTGSLDPFPSRLKDPEGISNGFSEEGWVRQASVGCTLNGAFFLASRRQPSPLLSELPSLIQEEGRGLHLPGLLSTEHLASSNATSPSDRNAFSCRLRPG